MECISGFAFPGLIKEMHIRFVDEVRVKVAGSLFEPHINVLHLLQGIRAKHLQRYLSPIR